MATLKELMAQRTPESQERIKAMANEMRLETRLYELREQLNLSQKEVAEAMGIKQPSVVAIEQRGSEMKIDTLRRYVEALGGKLSIDVELPGGKHFGFTV
ncbi:XRE family transcriptional regulator [Serratia sp. M24T3]|uniref:XRE family transcriptional regulator n=1 Tax=Rouxiella sp. WC2420 TaxID=3234145 RepID=A0AB39VQN1_9GAMM|nr:XRE family transcriptional regulator [Serratia sp. M24T3]EIC85772.1 helix-turn-helix domain-containing protein [Serratia sp. M24T3]